VNVKITELTRLPRQSHTAVRSKTVTDQSPPKGGRLGPDSRETALASEVNTVYCRGIVNYILPVRGYHVGVVWTNVPSSGRGGGKTSTNRPDAENSGVSQEAVGKAIGKDRRDPHTLQSLHGGEKNLLREGRTIS